MTYELEWKTEAIEDVKSLETEYQQRIMDKLEWFAAHPDRKQNVKYISQLECLRYRVGDYRIFFTKDDENETITILAVEKRTQAYK